MKSDESSCTFLEFSCFILRNRIVNRKKTAAILYFWWNLYISQGSIDFEYNNDAYSTLAEMPTQVQNLGIRKYEVKRNCLKIVNWKTKQKLYTKAVDLWCIYPSSFTAKQTLFKQNHIYIDISAFAFLEQLQE